MKIIFFESKPHDPDFFRHHVKGHNLIFVKEPLTEANAKFYKSADIICTFIYSKCDKEALSHLPKLKLIATRSTGFDHIDIEYCRSRKIKVSNVPSYGENTVAEHTFALLLNISRKVHKSYIRTLENNFSIQGMEGFDLKGKTLGVIGAGKIGLNVIKIAKGFGMHVLAYDTYKNQFMADLLHFRYTSLDDIYRSADIITLHTPSTTETKHIINRASIRKMKNGVIIINTARGDLIDTDDLYHGLKSGKIGGAGLDVIEGEDIIKEDKELLQNETNPIKLKRLYQDEAIFHMDNVVFTPHNAFNGEEALLRILETTSDNIKGFFDGKVINEVK